MAKTSFPSLERPIYVFGTPTPAQWQLIRDAKQALNVDFYVKPEQATPGCDGRILAFAEPDFACDSAMVATVDTVERMIPPLSHVLGLTDHPRAASMESWLSKALGRPGVREVTKAELIQEKREAMPFSQRLKLDIK